MGINKESDISANLQIGPTSAGMVRIYVEGDGFDLPLDFEPEEALEIAEEIRLAAERAREMGAPTKSRKAGGGRGPDLSSRAGQFPADRTDPKPGPARKGAGKPPRG